MSHFLDTVERWAAVTLFALCLVLGWCVDYYRHKFQATSTELQQLQTLTAAQNNQAQMTLQRLTVERDATQARLDTQYQQQEKADAQAQKEIARLAGELERRPIRVRVIPQSVIATCGTGGGGAAGDQAAAAEPGAADTAPAYGLLPPTNSARLAGVIAEIETLNAAYTSCRMQLMP